MPPDARGFLGSSAQVIEQFDLPVTRVARKFTNPDDSELGPTCRTGLRHERKYYAPGEGAARAGSDRARADAWFNKYDKMPADLKTALAAARDVPVDVDPQFSFPETVE